MTNHTSFVNCLTTTYQSSTHKRLVKLKDASETSEAFKRALERVNSDKTQLARLSQVFEGSKATRSLAVKLPAVLRTIVHNDAAYLTKQLETRVGEMGAEKSNVAVKVGQTLSRIVNEWSNQLSSPPDDELRRYVAYEHKLMEFVKCYAPMIKMMNGWIKENVGKDEHLTKNFTEAVKNLHVAIKEYKDHKKEEQKKRSAKVRKMQGTKDPHK
jgi:hypothetical protein